MKLNNLFHILAIIFLFFMNACTQNEKKELAFNKFLISLSADSTAVELSGLSPDVMEELRADSLKDSHWVNFFAVYEEPSDPEMRDFQPFIEGTYQIEGGLIRFRPMNKFKPGFAYFARSYTRMLLLEPEDLLEKRELFSSDGFIEYKFRIP